MEKETITRQELYNLVWSFPMTTLSKKYAISDVGLRKICIRMNILMPQAGHWQKLKFGKKINKKTLMPITKRIWKYVWYKKMMNLKEVHVSNQLIKR